MKIIISIVLALFIAGCSSGPTETELNNALTKFSKAALQVNWDNLQRMSSYLPKEQIEKMGAVNPDNFKIIDLSIEESHENDKGDYVVKTTYTVVMGKKKQTDSRQYTLTRQNDSWSIVSAQ